MCSKLRGVAMVLVCVLVLVLAAVVVVLVLVVACCRMVSSYRENNKIGLGGYSTFEYE